MRSKRAGSHRFRPSFYRPRPHASRHAPRVTPHASRPTPHASRLTPHSQRYRPAPRVAPADKIAAASAPSVSRTGATSCCSASAALRGPSCRRCAKAPARARRSGGVAEELERRWAMASKRAALAFAESGGSRHSSSAARANNQRAKRPSRWGPRAARARRSRSASPEFMRGTIGPLPSTPGPRRSRADTDDAPTDTWIRPGTNMGDMTSRVQ